MVIVRFLNVIANIEDKYKGIVYDGNFFFQLTTIELMHP
jgi:hypothetical protein